MAVLLPADLHYLSTTLVPTGNPKDVDLDSASATKTLRFAFPGDADYKVGEGEGYKGVNGQYWQNITLLSTANPANVCMEIKRHLFRCFSAEDYRAPGLVRMEPLKLDRMMDSTRTRRRLNPKSGAPLLGNAKGWVLVAPYIATAPTVRGRIYSIVCVLVPGDPDARWFYTPFVVTNLLRYLSDQTDVLEVQDFQVGSLQHRRFFTFICNEFPKAVGFPHSPDFVNAMALTDCCPAIQDEEGALKRLEMNEFLHYSTGREREKGDEKPGPMIDGGASVDAVDKARETDGPSDDRYLLQLCEAERMVASMVGLKCAEYLFVKRNFFKVFYEEVYRSNKPVSFLGFGANNANSTRARASRTSTSAADPPLQDSSNPAPTAGPAPVAVMVAEASPPPPHRRTARPKRGFRASDAREDTPQRTGTSYTPSPGPSATAATATAGTATSTPARGRSGIIHAAGGSSVRRGGAPTGWRKKVRTEHAHQVWLEKEYAFKSTRAKVLVVAWRELGFLDEGEYVEWVKARGMFEE